MAWRTEAIISRMIVQSSMDKLPGSVCSIVSLTSGPINLAHVAKKTVGLVLAVCSMAPRPSSDQISARSFKNPAENAVLDPTGRPFGLPDCPGFQAFKLGYASIVSHCYYFGKVCGEGPCAAIVPLPSACHT